MTAILETIRRCTNSMQANNSNGNVTSVRRLSPARPSVKSPSSAQQVWRDKARSGEPPFSQEQATPSHICIQISVSESVEYVSLNSLICSQRMRGGRPPQGNDQTEPRLTNLSRQGRNLARNNVTPYAKRPTLRACRIQT